MSLKNFNPKPTNPPEKVTVSGKTGQIAAQLMTDILFHLYGLKNVDVDYGTTNERLFCLRINLEDPPKENIQKFEQDLAKTQNSFPEKTDYYNKEKIISFSNVINIAWFFEDFLINSDWYPEVAVELDFSELESTIELTDKNLIRLKRQFYWDYKECAADIKLCENEKLEKFGHFIYMPDHLEKSLDSDLIRSNSNKNYDSSSVFHFH